MTKYLAVCQCEGCGRIRLPDGTWVRDDSVTPDVTGTCATCMETRHRAHERKRVGEIRRLRRGDLKTPRLDNPFDGVKYDAGDETPVGLKLGGYEEGE